MNYLSFLTTGINGEVIVQLLLALLLGASLGWERERFGKPAGVRTFSLVSVGSALYAILSGQLAAQYLGFGFDPSRVVSQIVVGIGFLGAGLIIHSGHEVIGLTTAAELWVVAGIGATIGLGYYGLAIITAFLSFLMIFVAKRWTKRIERSANKEESGHV